MLNPGSTGDLGVKVKGSNIMKFYLQSQFQRFLYQTSFVFSEVKDIHYFNENFHSVTYVMPSEWDLGYWG